MTAKTGARGNPSAIAQPVPELPVTDVIRAQHYYRDHLGFEIAWLWPSEEIGAVSRGEAVVFLRRTPEPFDSSTSWIFSENVDELYEEYSDSGARIVEPIADKPWGLRQFAVEDLDGNRFYIHHD